MKNKSTSLLVLILALAFVLTSCSSSSTAVNSWSGASAAGDFVYYVGSGQVFALKAENGNKVWAYPEKANNARLFMAAPALVGEQLIVGDYAHKLTSLSIRDGAENWQFVDAQGRYIDSPLVFEDTIIAPNADGFVYALNTSGNLLWSFEGEASFWAQPVTDGTTVYAPSLDHYLYALDLKTGAMKWKTDLKASLVARPLLDNGIIYVGNLEGGFFAIDSNDGSIKWERDIESGIWSAPLLVNSKLYFGDQDGKVNIVIAEDGYLSQTVEYDSAILGTGVDVTDGLLFGTENGDLVKIGYDGAKLWTRSVEGALYSNLLINGDRVLVVATNGEKALVAMDVNGNENWYFSTK